jgi:hypothetical protein
MKINKYNRANKQNRGQKSYNHLNYYYAEMAFEKNSASLHIKIPEENRNRRDTLQPNKDYM